jgi:uridine kinase
MAIAQTQTITRVAPRDSIRVTFSDGLVLEGALGTTIEAFLQAAEQQWGVRHNSDIMGGILDEKLRELAYPIVRDAKLEPVLLSSSDGARIYRRSLVLLMAVAIDELWPNTKVAVRYSVYEGGFYCTLLNRTTFTVSELDQLDTHMREIVAANDPITKQVVPLDEATAIFATRDNDDKLRLLEQRTRNELTLYTLRSRPDYYYGYMLPSTGYLRYFRLVPIDGGFILQYPRKEYPTDLPEINAATKLSAVFRQADAWLQKTGIEDMGRLNRLVRQDHAHELILVAEAFHEQQIAYIARDIYERHEDSGARLVLIAGPSSSGKTTFAKRLAIQLLAHGLRPFTLELDNYFVDRDLTPRDEKGDFDFEALEAIDLNLFNSQILELMSGWEVRLPRFDFIKGRSVEGRLARLAANQMIIVEGIHGLNPKLVSEIPAENIYRVYVSALTQLNLDAHNRVPTTDVRLLRRIARDAVQRGHDAASTLSRWPSVRRGEKRNIFPYQENADVMFNSALAYELAALRPIAEPLLLQVEPRTPPHIEANRLLSFLRWVQPLAEKQMAMIPDTSLLREFIGGSSLANFHPGEIHGGNSKEH